MPIALLIQESTLLWRFSAKQLSPWGYLAALEEVLIDRARSAFLVRWFGPHFPLHGSQLRIVVHNLIELRNRYLLAVATAEPEVGGPNLFEPLASLAGEVAGLILSPAGAVLTAVAATRKTTGALGTLIQVASAIGAAFLGPVAAGLVVGLGVPLGPGAGVFASTLPSLGDKVKLLGALARLLDAVTSFIKQIMGLRSEVRNPLLRSLLNLFDHLAGLVPQVLGFLAYAVVRFGPMLPSLAKEVVAFPPLIDASLGTILFIIDNLTEVVKGIFAPNHSLIYVIDFVIEQLGILFPAIVIGFYEVFQQLGWKLTALYGPFVETFKGLFKDVKTGVADAIQADPTMLRLDAIKGAFKKAGDILDIAFLRFSVDVVFGATKEITISLVSSSSSLSKSPFPKFPDIDLDRDVRTPEALLSKMGTPPSFDDIQQAASKMVNDARAAMPLSEKARRGLEEARHPPSVFAGEEEALAKSLGAKSPKEALASNLAAQQVLRDRLTVVVGRILPPQLRTYMASVIGLFGSLDESLSLDPMNPMKPKKGKKKEPVDYPVRELRDNGQLLPVVHRLKVVATGATKLGVQDFEDRLQRALAQQSYPAPFGP